MEEVSSPNHNKTNTVVALVSMFGVFILIGLLVFLREDPSAPEVTVTPSSQTITEQPTPPINEVTPEVSAEPAPAESQPTQPVVNAPAVADPNAGTPIKQNYVNYSKTALDQILKDEGQALLFFYADWCPTCRSADKSIQKDHTLLPKGLTILKLNYDTETDLKRQYNVTAQHTFVHVNRQGKEISKWLGGGVETILENL